MKTCFLIFKLCLFHYIKIHIFDTCPCMYETAVAEII
jgi:hypothetical protein